MPTRVRSYAKINLGLAIGPPRPDGFHALSTLYQTLALYDHLTVSARRARATRIRLTSTDPRVPTDARNTVWKMVERTLAHLHLTAEVVVDIQKTLPIQGGLGAGSANAAAALVALERELDLRLQPAERLVIAAEVGSDVPLFLVGGTVLGSNRGEQVEPAPDLTLDGRTGIACVLALPRTGVSTPQAFRDWDARFTAGPAGTEPGKLHQTEIRDTVEKLSRTYASIFHEPQGLEMRTEGSGATGITSSPGFAPTTPVERIHPANPQDSREQRHASLSPQGLGGHSGGGSDSRYGDQASRSGVQSTLSALLRTGMIENDFEQVVFPQHPALREIKHVLLGEGQHAAIHAALSGSGSALFGLYRSANDALEAQQRLQQHGTAALVTETIARPRYWSDMFAE